MRATYYNSLLKKLNEQHQSLSYGRDADCEERVALRNAVERMIDDVCNIRAQHSPWPIDCLLTEFVAPEGVSISRNYKSVAYVKLTVNSIRERYSQNEDSWNEFKRKIIQDFGTGQFFDLVEFNHHSPANSYGREQNLPVSKTFINFHIKFKKATERNPAQASEVLCEILELIFGVSGGIFQERVA